MERTSTKYKRIKIKTEIKIEIKANKNGTLMCNIYCEHNWCDDPTQKTQATKQFQSTLKSCCKGQTDKQTTANGDRQRELVFATARNRTEWQTKGTRIILFALQYNDEHNLANHNQCQPVFNAIQWSLSLYSY